MLARGRGAVDARGARYGARVASLLLVGAAAFAVACLTLFSGFGLGTLLLPAFALVFPVEVAVAATAVVHAANNAFKVALLRGHVEVGLLLRFGLPAVAASFVGGALLARLSGREPLLRWELGGVEGEVTPVRLVMGALVLAFALVDLLPALRPRAPHRRWLPLGGALSGFFGGLSGHQGALRAAFLTPLGLAPAAYAATQAAIACGVDAARLSVYGASFFAGRMAGVETREGWALVAFATACAFAGSLLGRRLLPHVTARGVRAVTGTLLLAVGAGLAAGLV